MDRTQYVACVDWLRKTARPTLVQSPLGRITIDAASLAGVTTTLRVGSALSIPLFRDSDLADDKYVLKNLAGSTIATNV